MELSTASHPGIPADDDRVPPNLGGPLRLTLSSLHAYCLTLPKRDGRLFVRRTNKTPLQTSSPSRTSSALLMGICL